MIPNFVFDHISIGPLNFYTWGFFVGLAFAVGYFLTLYRAKKKNISVQQILILTWVVFFGAALGSRVAYLLQFPRELLSDISLLWRYYQGGLMIWGGILGAILLGGLYIKITKLNLPHPNPLLIKERERVRFSFWTLADLFTPAVALGIGIGRIGCFLINDHIGAPTSLPWGISWPDGISRHPVALYESLVGFALFAIFWWLYKRIYSSSESREAGRVEKSNDQFSTARKPAIAGLRFARTIREGFIFLSFLTAYSVIRFFLDFLRASKGILADPHWWGLTTSQWISLAIFLVAMLFFIRNKKGERVIS